MSIENERIMPKETAPTPFEQGNNNVTRIEQDRVFKATKGFGVERNYSEQVKQWNNYYQNSPYATACMTENGELSLPYISGDYPTSSELLSCLEEMLQRGFVMGDCRDRRNFIVHDNKVYPVDFGQIYNINETYYSMHKKQHLAEINKLISKIRIEHSIVIIEGRIAELRQYKEKKLKPTDPKAAIIDNFIADTEKRIAAFTMGRVNAFDSYATHHQETITILNESPITEAIWKSILLVLCTGIFPALIGGAIQAAVTEGNSFLFFSKNTPCGQMALGVHEEVVQVAAMTA